MMVSIGNAARNFINIVSGKNNPTSKSQNLILSAMPTPARGVSLFKSIKNVGAKGISAIKNDISSVKNMISGSSGSMLKKLGVGLGTGAAVGTAYEISRAVSAKEKPSLSTIAKAGIQGLSFGLSKAGAISGVGVGTAEGLINKILPDRKMSIPEGLKNLPSTMTDTFTMTRGDMDNLFDSFNNSLSNGLNNMGMPQTPLIMLQTPTTGGGGFNVNVPSSGIGENLPLMMLLLAGGAGAGGFLLGRKKKKKYKKKRKHKKR